MLLLLLPTRSRITLGNWVVFDNILSIFVILYNTTGMSQLKVINASRGCIHKYENIKKLNNCNANIYFNRQCLQKQLIPNYARIKVLNTSPAFKYTCTQHKVPNIRIKDEINYLYKKKTFKPTNMPFAFDLSKLMEQYMAVYSTNYWWKTEKKQYSLNTNI